MVFVSSWIPFRFWNLCTEMTEKGYAVVYEGKTGEFGDCEAELRSAESLARRKKRGMHGLKSSVSPMDYKKGK